MAHLENIDLALTHSPTAGRSRSYTSEHVAQLLELVSQHCQQKKMPALFAFTERLSGKPVPDPLVPPPPPPGWEAAGGQPPQEVQQLAAAAAAATSAAADWNQQGFRHGMLELGPRLSSLRISDPGLLTALSLEQLSQLEFLELNLHRSSAVVWQDLAKLPALHSLMLSPPISPSSSGLGPEHAQQVVPTLLSFSIPVKELLEGLAASPATAGRMKQLLMQQTGTWDEPAVSLLSSFTALEALRLFPGPNSPDALWHNLAPVSRLRKLQELQLVGYSPVNFSNGAATGENPSSSFQSRHS